jgi:NADH-quinone oxidoreductase subunit N
MVAVMLRFYWFAMPLVGRINLVATWMMIFVILSAISMTVGNLCALSQTNLKRMMAYSGVGQIGYVLMGLASCGAVTGFPGVVGAGWRGTAACLFYIAVYAVANLGVWAVISIAERNSGNADLDSMNGLAQRNPYLAFVLSICLMSLAGVPPLAGFFGKFFLFRAVYQANLPFLLVLGILNSVISLYYYFKVLRAAYFGNPPADRGNFGLSTAQAFCLGVCLVVCVGCGLNNRLNNWTERIPQYVEGIGR